MKSENNNHAPKEGKMKNYTAIARQLLANANDRHEPVRENPVTGGRFVPGLDPLYKQVRLAAKALEARDWFEQQRPVGAPQLPLTYHDRERIKTGGVDYIVSLFARSLATRDYLIDDHPDFAEYACGVMAEVELTPDLVRNDPGLLEAYPPRPLTGMGNGLVWHSPSK